MARAGIGMSHWSCDPLLAVARAAAPDRPVSSKKNSYTDSLTAFKQSRGQRLSLPEIRCLLWHLVL